MKSLVKKIVVVSLIGVMTLGLGASITEASARHYDKQHHEQRYESHDKDRAHRIQEERDRHEREMRQREHENEWEYRERQEREREHHEEVMRTLGGIALLAIILNSN